MTFASFPRPSRESNVFQGGWMGLRPMCQGLEASVRLWALVKAVPLRAGCCVATMFGQRLHGIASKALATGRRRDEPRNYIAAPTSIVEAAKRGPLECLCRAVARMHTPCMEWCEVCALVCSGSSYKRAGDGQTSTLACVLARLDRHVEKVVPCPCTQDFPI